ncbi:MAG: hypothetical protein LBQ96_05590 [Fusobacteriaceae bacterium]|jgi:hypothetical protein|nr:hypothetical protein [Fusobacteriaceae bacterium]
MKRRCVLLPVALILIAGACVLKDKDGAVLPGIRNVEYQDSGDRFQYKVSIPQFENITSDDVSNLNVALQENARIVIDNVTADEGDDDEDDTLQRDAMISYDIKDNNFDILSIVLDTYLYQGDGNPIGYIESYNLSKKSLKLLEFDDIFIPEAEAYFEKYIKKSAAQYPQTRVIVKGYQDDRKGQELPFSQVDFKVKSAVLYFEGNDVVFVYPSYEIVGDAYKMIVFRIGRSEISSYIRGY